MFEDDEEDEQSFPIASIVMPANPLEYLQSVYRNPSEPDGRRMRAAMAALPFESPKLTAMAVSSLNGEHFSAMLEKAIARSREPQRVIEHRPNDGPVLEPRPRGIYGRSGEGQR